MTTSPAQNASTTATKEPLKGLLETIERAREVPGAEPYESDKGDPLARLRQIIAAEAARQAETTPSAWDAGAQQRVTSARTAAAAATPAAPTPGSPAAADVEARVGREVLALLRTQPLPPAARAAAVERLAAQIDNPNPDALRQVLAILVTGQHE